jgi:exopolyphosphatase/guanosine-5'-triphosphate,3'-diphosphate pyrophosphatase
MIIATVDIGSNATRVVLVKGEPLDSKNRQNLILKKRFALRLGTDVFQIGHISNEKFQQIMMVFKEIKDYFYQYKVSKYKIVATSAFRDAKNHKLLVQEIYDRFQLKVDVIDGKEEARIISSSLLRRKLAPPTHSSLLMDIGGGSLEVSIANEEKIDFVTSLNIGTLRLIEDIGTGQLKKDYYGMLDKIDNIFLTCPAPKKKSIILGTGGNFRRIGRIRKALLGLPEEDLILRKDVPTLIGMIMDLDPEHFMKAFSMKEENVPVVLPALLMIQRILHFWPANEIVIPKISLNHGLVDELIG